MLFQAYDLGLAKIKARIISDNPSNVSLQMDGLTVCPLLNRIVVSVNILMLLFFLKDEDIFEKSMGDE